MIDEISKSFEQVGETAINMAEAFDDMDDAICVMAVGMPIRKWPNKMLFHWDMVITYLCERCPNKRVVHLLQYAKKDRAKLKNIRRAIRILENNDD